MSTVKKTGFVYSEETDFHRDSDSLDKHPENPDRTTLVYSMLNDDGCLDDCDIMTEVRLISDEEMYRVHEREYIKILSELSKKSEEEILYAAEEYDSIYLNRDSFYCARIAAGLLLTLVDAVLNNKVDNGFALVRPPGHHSCCAEAEGFCILNNVALAVRHAQSEYKVKKVLIVDWDIHHGDGTQEIFKNDPNVLFVSIHRFENGKFYPHKGAKSDYRYVGENSGQNFNINIPFNLQTMGSTEYMHAFMSVILPVAYEFDPELIFISCGFDAGRRDPLGGYNVDYSCFGHMTHHLTSLSNRRVIMALEGGYNIETVFKSTKSCLNALMGKPLSPLKLEYPMKNQAILTVNRVVKVQRMFWKSLNNRVDPKKMEKVKIQSKKMQHRKREEKEIKIEL